MESSSQPEQASQTDSQHASEDVPDSGPATSTSGRSTQTTVFVTTLIISALAVLYRNIDLHREARFDVAKVRAGLSSHDSKQRMSAATSALLVAGMPHLRQQFESSGLAELLVEMYRSEQDSSQFAAVCIHALARVCISNGPLCKRLLKSYDLVRLSFRKLDAGVESRAEQAAIYSLLAALGPHSRVVARKLSQPDTFASLVEQLQSSAATDASDMAAGVSQLLAFAASVDDLRQRLMDSGAFYTWIQVAQAQKGDAATAAAITALDAVAAYHEPALNQIISSGIPGAVVAALKEQSNVTTGPALTLAMRLASHEMGRWTLVNNNALSICGQMWYSGKVMFHWRMGCAQLLLATAGLEDMQDQIPAAKQVLAALMTLARDVEHPAMQSAALDAVRDIAHVRAAALNMAESSVIASIVSLLGTTVPKEPPGNAEADEATGWQLRSRRAIAATLALLSTHQDLRGAVLGSHGAAALVAIIHSTPGPGLAAQTRVAAAAAMVALGQDPDARQQLVVAGSMQVLSQMLQDPATRQEQETAAAALKLMQQGVPQRRLDSQKTEL